MADKEPIELPALSAQRRGPSAAVCENGHVASWFLDVPPAEQYCRKCGAAILVSCPSCKTALPADAEMLEWVPYHGNCPECGQPYPWKAGDIRRAKRTLTERSELQGWSKEVKARADELIDDIAADRATASAVSSGVKWLERHGAEDATAAILDAVERLGSMALKQSLRSTFPGLF